MHTSWIPVSEGLGFAYVGFSTCLQPVGSVSASIHGLWGIQNNKQAGKAKREIPSDQSIIPVPKSGGLKNEINPAPIGTNYNVYFVILRGLNPQGLIPRGKGQLYHSNLKGSSSQELLIPLPLIY